jgi:hypothetical protein
MLDRFGTQGSGMLAQNLARSTDSVTSAARRLGLPSLNRRGRQALSRALGNTSVNIKFFDSPSEQVAAVLGYLWVRGQVKRGLLLRLRCPTPQENALLEVRDLLESRHQVQRCHGYTVCMVCSTHLVQTLTRNYGSPPSQTHPCHLFQRSSSPTWPGGC